jgi:hypothetical protein
LLAHLLKRRGDGVMYHDQHRVTTMQLLADFESEGLSNKAKAFVR